MREISVDGCPCPVDQARMPPPMDIDAYLARLAYAGPTSPSVATLSALHLAHLFTVPFENLDIGQRPIVLDEAAFFEKIVRRRRGGFCYELNGLFAALLRDLGFRVTLVSGRAANATGGFGPEFDHLALLVDLDERWLVDVGFGDSFLEPLRLHSREITIQRKREYRLDEAEGEWTLQQREGEWEPQFRFTLEARSSPISPGCASIIRPRRSRGSPGGPPAASPRRAGESRSRAIDSSSRETARARAAGGRGREGGVAPRALRRGARVIGRCAPA